MKYPFWVFDWNRVKDYQEKWNINDQEREVILRWMTTRMKEIQERT